MSATPGSGRFLAVSALLAVMVAIVCSLTFLHYPVLDHRTSIVLEADTNDYVHLLMDSRWRWFLDPTAQASLTWEEQRKVLHHVAYFPVAEGVTRILMLLAAPAGGMARRTAIYAINGVLTLVNIVLLAVLLRRLTPRASLAFVLLFVFSLSTWVYGALPDTWVLSGTFVLLTVLMASSRIPLGLVSAAIGLFMLNNFTLASATLILVPRVVGRSGETSGWLRRAVAATAPALVVWVVATQLLATTQPLFHLTDFARATAAFQHTLLPEPRSPVSPIRWGVAFAQLFVLSIICNQSALNVSAPALLRTAANVPFGSIGVVLLLSAYVVAGYRFLQEASQTDGRRSVLSGAHAGILLFVLAAYASGTLGIYVDIIVHSPVVVPSLVLLLARYVGTETRATRGLIWTLVGSAFVNAVLQVAQFRAVLDTIQP